jgi:hypothetical protein
MMKRFSPDQLVFVLLVGALVLAVAVYRFYFMR